MKIAITTGALKVPPTYFVVNHAQLLRDEHEFEAFALVADVTDEALTVPVHDAAPFARAQFEKRFPTSPLGIPCLTRKIQRFRPDIIHQHFATWSGPAISVSRRNEVPLITTVHGYDILLARRGARSIRDRWNLLNVENSRRHSHRVLAVSEFLAGEAMKADFDSSRLDVHYQGVDTDFFRPSSVDERSSDVPVVAFVGVLAERKGIRDLIRASNSLVRSVEHRLVIMGSGPLASFVQEEADRASHIEVVGSVPRAEVRNQLQNATLMVLPTQEHSGWREAAGLVLVEAQACGTPVVAYSSGGTPEMMEAGVSGLLVKERDTTALASAITEILGLGVGEYRSMSQSARAFAENKRSLRESCQELDAHYSALASQ